MADYASVSTRDDGTGVGGRRRRARKGLSMSECVKLSLSGILTGIIFVQVFDSFTGEPYDAQVDVTATLGSAPTEKAPAPTEPPVPLAPPESTAQPTVFPTQRPTPSPTTACLMDSPRKRPAWTMHDDSYPWSASDARVFILGAEEALDTRHEIDCLLRMLEVPRAEVGDEEVDVDVIEHSRRMPNTKRLNYALTDVLLMDGLKRHPSRVYNIEEANIVVPDLLPYLSFELPEGDLLKELCPALYTRGSTHWERMDKARAELQHTHHFKQGENKGMYVFIHSRPLGQAGSMNAFTKALADVIVQGGSVVATSSAKFLRRWYQTRISKRTQRASNKLVRFERKLLHIPLRTNPYLRDRVPSEERPIDFFFEETVVNKNIVTRMKNLALENSHVLPSQTTTSGILDSRFSRARGFLLSKVCLVMDFENGEEMLGLQTLFDAIQAGCIPLIMAETGPPLPFSSLLDWTSGIILTAGLKCLAEHWEDLQIIKDRTSQYEFVSNKQAALGEWAAKLRYPTSFLDPRADVPEAAPTLYIMPDSGFDEPEDDSGRGRHLRRAAQDQGDYGVDVDAEVVDDGESDENAEEPLGDYAENADAVEPLGDYDEAEAAGEASKAASEAAKAASEAAKADMPEAAAAPAGNGTATAAAPQAAPSAKPTSSPTAEPFVATREEEIINMFLAELVGKLLIAY